LVSLNTDHWILAKTVSGANVTSLDKGDSESFSADPHLAAIPEIGVYDLTYNDHATDSVRVSTDPNSAPCP
jgi:hypothetical protein